MNFNQSFPRVFSNPRHPRDDVRDYEAVEHLQTHTHTNNALNNAYTSLSSERAQVLKEIYYIAQARAG